MSIGEDLLTEYNEFEQDNIQDPESLKRSFKSFYREDVQHMLENIALNYKKRLIEAATIAVRQHHKLKMTVDAKGWVAAYLTRSVLKFADGAKHEIIPEDAAFRSTSAKEAIKELIFENYDASTSNFLLQHLTVEFYYSTKGVDIISSVVIPYVDLLVESDAEEIFDRLNDVETELNIYLVRQTFAESDETFTVEIDH